MRPQGTAPAAAARAAIVRGVRRRGALATVLAAVALLVAGIPATTSAASVATGAGARAVTSGGNGINDVSCGPTGQCVAVGQYAVAHGFHPLVDVERHSAWSEVVVPLPAFANSEKPDAELSAVSCTTGTSCVAVGSVVDASGRQHALLESESGGAWRSITVPLPAGATTTDDGLVGVSCPTASSCVAVGSYSTATKGDVGPLVVVDASGTWSAVTAPLPGDADTSARDDPLLAVSCRSGPDCTAVGSYASTTNGEEALMETDTDGTWSDTPVPLPGDASTARTTSDVLDTVSCSSDAACVAAGSYDDVGGNQEPLLDVEASSSWANVVAALPGDANTAPTLDVLNRASCSSDGNCVAVGVYETEDNYQEALLEVETAGTWANVAAAVPSDANTVVPLDTLSGVSCPEDGNCVAVGFYSSSESYVYPKAFLEVEVNGSWVAGGVAPPADESATRPLSELSSISCVSILACVAGGVYLDLAGDAQALVDDLGVGLTNVSVVPGAPTNVVAHAGHGQATVSWRAPRANGGSPITRYTVTASPGGRSCMTTGRTSCTVRPLSPTGYTFTVTASSAIGTSIPSKPSVPVVVGPPVDGAIVLAPFAEGSAALSAHLRAQLVSLATRILADGNTVVSLVGYNDDVGSSAHGAAVSLARAEAVRAALHAWLAARGAAYVVLTVRAGGDADPVASNATAAGRAANRRVVATTN